MTLLGAGCLLLGPMAAGQDLSASQEPEALEGIWGATLSCGPELRGPIVVLQDEGEWRAQIQGYEATVERLDGSEDASQRALRFEFPGGLGVWTGRLGADGLSGFWIQPAGRLASQEYATPCSLEARAESTTAGPWFGRVSPREDQLSLYFEFFRNDAGELRVHMRNPERNLGLFYSLGRVERQGRAIRMLDAAGEELVLEGQFSTDGQRWSLELPGWPGLFEFTKRTRDTAPGYFPRDSSQAVYRYSKPLELGDAWPVAEPETVGLRREPLEALVQSVLDTEYEGRATPYIQTVLIARRGKLVLDESFYGYHRGRTHDTRSSAKSLAAMLVGIAIDRGAPWTVETPLLEVLGKGRDIQNVDERKRAITIEHLLTMRSGLDCDDDDGNSPGNEEQVQGQTAQPDWVAYALDLPMARPPGEQAVYCTAGIHLLAAVLETAGDDGLLAWFSEVYAEPLGIHHYHWNLSPVGRPYQGGGVELRSRDHLKLGQLLADGGRWRGRQVVSAAWVQATGEAHGSIHQPDDYGYGTWRTRLESGGQSYDVVYASGNGGQLVIAIPSLELVVLFAGGNYMNYPTWSRFLNDLVPRYVLAALDD